MTSYERRSNNWSGVETKDYGIQKDFLWHCELKQQAKQQDSNNKQNWANSNRTIFYIGIPNTVYWKERQTNPQGDSSGQDNWLRKHLKTIGRIWSSWKKYQNISILAPSFIFRNPSRQLPLLKSTRHTDEGKSLWQTEKSWTKTAKHIWLKEHEEYIAGRPDFNKRIKRRIPDRQNSLYKKDEIRLRERSNGKSVK